MLSLTFALGNFIESKANIQMKYIFMNSWMKIILLSDELSFSFHSYYSIIFYLDVFSLVVLVGMFLCLEK